MVAVTVLVAVVLRPEVAEAAVDENADVVQQETAHRLDETVVPAHTRENITPDALR